MAVCAHLLLCHDAPALAEAKIAALREAGDPVAVHVDARAARTRAALARAFRGDPGVVFAPGLRCGWGDWSLVEATLRLARTGLTCFPAAGHFLLGSTDCLPTMPAAQMRAALADGARDWIEAKDFLRSGWVQTGISEERLLYRHYVNERAHPRLFYAMVRAQRRLGLRRRLPQDFAPRIGSQWWLLRAGSLRAALALHDARPDLARFFRRVWIPDECYLQSLVAACTPADQRMDAPPTRLMFSDYGRPVVFHADHEALLRGAPDRFFARKITRADPGFRARLLRLYARGEAAAPRPAHLAAPGARGPDPAAFYDRIRHRGRRGILAAPRVWDRTGAVAPGLQITAVLSKKWHLAETGAALVAEARGLPGFGPIFDDPAPVEALALRGAEALGALGGLGGIDRSLDKRRRAPGMLLATLAGLLESPGLVFAADPARTEVLRALIDQGAQVTALKLRAPCSDAYLMGHAERIGLWSGASPPPEVRAALLRSLRAEIEAESRDLGAAPGLRLVRLRAGGAGLSPEAVAARGDALAEALGISEARGRALARDLKALG